MKSKELLVYCRRSRHPNHQVLLMLQQERVWLGPEGLAWLESLRRLQTAIRVVALL